MHKEIGTLVAFTILIQMGVGTILIYKMIQLFNPGNGMPVLDLKVTIILSVCLLLGLLLSFLHLGHPQHAIYATQNLGHSWLSREIFLLLILVILTGSMLLILTLYEDMIILLKWLQWLSIITGILLVYSMSRIYMLETVPAWNRLATPVSFYNTAFVLGPVVLLLVSLTNNSIENAEYSKNLILVLSLICIVALVLNLLIQVFGPITINSLYWIRIASNFVGVAMMIGILLTGVLEVSTYRRLLLLIIFAIIFTGEIIGRIQFFHNYARIGV